MKLILSSTVTLNLPLQEAKELSVVYNNACNFLSELAFYNKNFNRFQLHKEYYVIIKNNFKLSSQFVCSVLKTVAAKYSAIKSNKQPITKPVFFTKEPVEFSLNRNITIDNEVVTIKTLTKRIKCTLQPHSHFKKLLKTYQIGGCNLFLRNNKVYLSVSFNREQQIIKELSVDNSKTLGIDLGIKNIATISNGKINKVYKAARIAAKKAQYQKIKSSLQSQKAQKLSRSIRRKGNLFKRKERNYVKNSNHIISLDIVNLAVKNNITCIKMEDLSEIKDQECSKEHRKRLHGWSYYELQTFIKYKANSVGISVLYIDPSYTSQTCTKCGLIDPINRIGLNFKCQGCNYKLHADLNAARNIARCEEAIKPKRVAKATKKVRILAPRKGKPPESILIDLMSTG